MPVFPDESAPIVRFVRKIRHFPGQKTLLLLSHDVNRLPVSLTTYANFVVNELFSVTVVNEMLVLLTTHESTNFSNLLFLLIQKIRVQRQIRVLLHFLHHLSCTLPCIIDNMPYVSDTLLHGTLSTWLMAGTCNFLMS